MRVRVRVRIRVRVRVRIRAEVRVRVRVRACGTSSNSPYRRPMATDLGLSTGVSTFICSGSPPSAIRVSAPASTRYEHVLAE